VPLEPELVAPIRAVDSRLDVLYDPELLPPVRYPGDHRGIDGFHRDPDGERRWRSMIEQAEVLFGIPGDSPAGLAKAVRANNGLRWVQATAAGAGEQVRAAGLTAEELARVAITSSSGVHAVPLAEFCLLGLLAFVKDLPRIQADQRAHRWGHYPMAELRGRTLLVVGLGKIGHEVARLAEAFGMRVVGINRAGASDSRHVHEVHPIDRLAELLPVADAVVISLPLTDETRGLIDRAALARMRRGATIVDVGRGGAVDEAALVDALRERRLAGAALDVYATEPLPADSPLWELPNVLLTPHTAALSLRENERIVELFCENLRRYLRGAELISRVDPELLY
jgi:phosphoglycerate dehydrogenase-like enzyme